MDAEEIKSRIKQHVGRVTGLAPEQITDSASYLNDLGLDSLSLMELTVDLEYAFKIKIPPEQVSQMPTVHDTITVVEKQLSVQRA